ncbi:MAG: cystathionine beta-lyase [Candidatus Eiseniibacteriota bacterium]
MKRDTLIVTTGRHPEDQHGLVNPPIYRGSTVLHKNLAHLEETGKRPYDHVRYGRLGTPTTFAFEEAMAALEGGKDGNLRSVAISSGMGACTAALMAFLKAGDHVLITDSVYAPVRRLAESMLADFGIATTFYDPRAGADIAKLIRANTKMIYLEAPGSQTFEMQDVPAIVAAAKARGVLTACDNTWASPYCFRPIEHGVDISIQSATKYIVGHSDAMLGVVTVHAERFTKLKDTATLLGSCPGPEDVWLGLRGIRTLAVRLPRHQENAMTVARWFQARPEVARVLYPALPEDPGHALWKRDFHGASGLFGVVFKDVPTVALNAFVDSLHHFGIGASFGGYESLVLPSHPEKIRTAVPWHAEGPLVRFHIGLEDPADLIADLEQGFEKLKGT